MANAFQIGDSVKLKSGGPDMSAQLVPTQGTREYYKCQWFAGKKLEDGIFPEGSLIAVVPVEK